MEEPTSIPGGGPIQGKGGSSDLGKIIIFVFMYKSI
ncbi:unnamed protein product [Arabidopsis halleri]